MKTCLWFFMLTGMAIGWSARAQGTLVFDQQSSTVESGPTGGLRFQDNQPFGQSFVPTLSSIGFVRLYMFAGINQNATVYVNVLSDSVTGPILGSTAPLTIPNYFAGYMNFYFTTPATLHPGTTYYLQPVATAGDPVTDVISAFYPNGSLFISGVEHVGEAIWFREGIVVPEPATVSLTLVAGSLLLLWRWGKSLTV